MRTRIPRSVLAQVVLAGAILAAPGLVRAADLVGLYAGAAVGQSNVKDGPIGFNQHDFAWQLTAGIRPLGMVGLEVDYLNFGAPGVNLKGLRADARERGAAAFAVAYLPLPLPILDVYGKAGLARIQNRVTASGECAAFNSCGLLSLNRTNTQFAWGVGGQIKWGSVAFRTEYEGFNAAGGSQALISLGALYTFL